MPNETSASSAAKLQIDTLFAAEIQFRLASAVFVAVTFKRQPIDMPQQWCFGNVSLDYEALAIRPDQAEVASIHLRNSCTYTLAVTIKDALEAIVPGLPNAVKTSNGIAQNGIVAKVNKAISSLRGKQKTWCVDDNHVAAAYQISRLIRNAYAHAPFTPKWMIQSPLQNQVFEIPDIFRLDTTNLNEKLLDWRHYGGPLALYCLSRYVRFEILGDDKRPRTNLPTPTRKIIQQGDQLLEQIEELPEGLTPIEPDEHGRYQLGNGHYISAQPERP